LKSSVQEAINDAAPNKVYNKYFFIMFFI
jgi:hypothetical protein